MAPISYGRCGGITNADIPTEGKVMFTTEDKARVYEEVLQYLHSVADEAVSRKDLEDGNHA